MEGCYKCFSNLFNCLINTTKTYLQRIYQSTKKVNPFTFLIESHCPIIRVHLYSSALQTNRPRILSKELKSSPTVHSPPLCQNQTSEGFLWIGQYACSRTYPRYGSYSFLPLRSSHLHWFAKRICRTLWPWMCDCCRGFPELARYTYSKPLCTCAQWQMSVNWLRKLHAHVEARNAHTTHTNIWQAYIEYVSVCVCNMI